MRVVKAAAVQLSPVLYSREVTVARELDAKIERLIETAVRRRTKDEELLIGSGP